LKTIPFTAAHNYMAYNYMAVPSPQGLGIPSISISIMNYRFDHRNFPLFAATLDFEIP